MEYADVPDEIDIDGERYHSFVCEYPYQGRKWGLVLCAKSTEEAEERLKAFSQGVVLGKLTGETLAKSIDKNFEL